MKKILVAGPTGLIGSTVVEQLQKTPETTTIALTRRPLQDKGPRLVQWQAQADDLLTGLKQERVDAVICCLGTTIKKAGGQKQFRYVDHDLVVGIGRWARELDVPVFSVVSSIGADADSKIFYSRVKGEMERDLKALQLPSLHIFHPSILKGPREEKRLGEAIGIVLMGLLSPLLIGGLQQYKPMAHDVLAGALIASAHDRSPGTHHYDFKGIQRLAGKK